MLSFVVSEAPGRFRRHDHAVVDEDFAGLLRWLGPCGELWHAETTAGCAQVTKSSSYPGVAEWTGYFLRARATDADALAVMAPRGGRAWRAAVS